MKIVVLAVLVVLTGLRLWLATTTDIAPSEAYAWMCAQRLDWAFFDGPGGTAALVRAGELMFGTGPLGLRAFFPIAALVASVGIYLLARAMHGPAAGLWAAATLNALPVFNLASIHPGSILPALVALLFAAWALWRALHAADGLLWWLVVGVAVGVALLFRYDAVASWIAIVAACVALPRRRAEFRRPGIYLAALLTAAAALPLIFWNQSQNWAAFAAGTFQTAMAFSLPALGAATMEAVGALSIFAALIVVVAMGFSVWNWQVERRGRYLLGWAGPFFGLWLWNGLHETPAAEDLLIIAGFAVLMIPQICGAFPRSAPVFRFAVLATAVTTAATLALARDDGNREPWSEISKLVVKIRDEAAPSSTSPIFVIAKDPAFTAALNYHLATRRGQDRIEVFLRESQDLASQFGLLPRYDDFVETKIAPDELFAELKAANPYVGRSAIYVTDEAPADLPQTITNAFLRVSPAATVTVGNPAGPTRVLRFYLCQDYQTMPL